MILWVPPGLNVTVSVTKTVFGLGTTNAQPSSVGEMSPHCWLPLTEPDAGTVVDWTETAYGCP